VLSSAPVIVQETHYDPWGVELSGLGYQYGGIKVNPYLYNGKEANTHAGVNLFDYGARMYDPAIGRWFVSDPLAEAAPGWTPYRYGFNNPMLYTDPTGMFEFVKGGYGELIEKGSVGYAGGETYKFVGGGEEGNPIVWVGINYAKGENGNPDGPVHMYVEYANGSKGDVGTYYVGSGGGSGGGGVSGGGGAGEVIGSFLRGAMWTTNTAVGAASTYTVYSGNYYKWNEVWHKTKTRGTAWRWEKRWDNFGAKAIRAKQVETVAPARALNGVLSKAGGALLIADIGLSGELKPSHAINGIMLGVSTTGVGAIAAGAWFVADFGTMGINYLINGEATGLGDMADRYFGTYKMYDGIY
jgi:RHS repeat-associated protein